MSVQETPISDAEDSETNQKSLFKCKYCCLPIPDLAKVCSKCGRHQSMFWQHFRVEQIGLIVSVIMLLVAFSQLKEAHKERVDASVALGMAKDAKVGVEKAKQQYDNLSKTLSGEISILKKRNELMALADRGISESSRKSLDKLKKISQSAPDTQTRRAAYAEYGRVIAFWENMREDGESPKIILPDGSIKEISNLSTEVLIKLLLSDKRWVVRRKSAQLLGSKKMFIVAEALIKAIKTDQNIEVVRDSYRSFIDITNMPESEKGGIYKAIHWWENNYKTIKF